MIRTINTVLKSHIQQCGWAVILMVSFALLLTIPQYSTAKLESRPTEARARACAVQDLAPFLDIVPDPDGAELHISARGVGELGGTVFANVGVGPGHDKRSYTMTYSDTGQVYVATATGFTPNEDLDESLSITTTLGLDSGVVDFYRAYVSVAMTQTINSVDGNLHLTLNKHTFPTDAYVVVVPSYAPPGPLSLGQRLVGSAYSVRASDIIPVSDKPMILRLYYDEILLADADPHTLSILVWDANPYHARWDELGGRLFFDQSYLAVATSRFGTYALVTTPAWRDEFDDFNGLSFPGETHDVTLGGTPENRALVLAGAALNGVAVSKPITPGVAFAGWGGLTFTVTVAPPTTTLSVDVLSLDGTPLLTDVVSGSSLAGLDPTQYPALKLRANFFSMTAGQTPALDAWRLAWEVETHRVYLPAVLK